MNEFIFEDAEDLEELMTAEKHNIVDMCDDDVMFIDYKDIKLPLVCISNSGWEGTRYMDLTVEFYCAGWFFVVEGTANAVFEGKGDFYADSPEYFMGMFDKDIPVCIDDSFVINYINKHKSWIFEHLNNQKNIISDVREEVRELAETEKREAEYRRIKELIDSRRK